MVETSENLVDSEEQQYSPEEAAFLAETEPEKEDEAGEEKEETPPVTVQETQPEVAAVEPAPKQIPLAELIQERRKRQEAEQRYTHAVARLESILTQAADTTVPEEIPDKNEDPVGYLAYQQWKTLEEIRSFKEERARVEKQAEEEKTQTTFLTQYQRSIDVFAQQTPDYNDAAHYLLKDRDEELQTLGIDDPGQRMQILQHDALTIGAHAMQMGKNPGEVFYNLAAKRGYKKTAPASPPPVSPLDIVRKGQQAATTLSGSGGSGTQEITVETLLAMDDEEFRKYTQGKKWHKLHGRK